MEQFLFTPRLRSLSTSLCSSCLRKARQALLPRHRSIGFQNSPRLQQARERHSTAHIARAGEQATPLDGYYAELLSYPTSALASATRTPPRPPPTDELPKTDHEDVLQKARIVFGSRLAGPAERRAELEKKSMNIAGVLVPPKPEEPDNCCMSGCVNCVWDRYRDELENWASKSALARERLLAQRKKEDAARQRAGVKGTGMMTATPGMPQHVAISMDDDGGGSEALWSSSEFAGGPGDLFKDIPVGIREFMKTEKMLKQRHAADAARVNA